MHPDVQQLIQQGRLPGALASSLEQLQPGGFCLHRSWGPGRVVEWDVIGDRMTIDFEGKPAHSMKLEFAAKQLEPLEGEHFLAQRLANPAQLREQAVQDPATFVRHVVRSHGGSMHMDDFEAAVTPLLPNGGFKPWWDQTKKKLKKDRSFAIPPRRTLPLEVHDETAPAGARLLDDILQARDLKVKIAAVRTLAEDLSVLTDPAAELAPVLADLSQTAGKAAGIRLPLALEMAILRDSLAASACPDADVPPPSLVDLLRAHRAKLAQAIPQMPVAIQRTAYEAFGEAFGETSLEEWLSHLRSAGARGVVEIARQLEAANHDEALLDELKRGVARRNLSIELYVWICHERNGLPGALFDVEFGQAMLLALEHTHGETGNKRGQRLRDLLSTEGSKIIPDLLAGSAPDEVRHFARRILQSPVFDELSRRSLMGHIIKTFPEVQDLLEGGKRTQGDDKLVVSWPSLETRKKQLEEIITVKIPANTKEIQVAREYGDLRENFEFKAAKQQQAVLNRQRAMLERELKNARATDFANADTGSVGIGTVVEIEDTQTGGRETFTILGAWDTDVDKGILSYLSATAQALIGHPVGALTAIPTDDDGDEGREVRIVGITAYVPAGGQAGQAT